MDAQDNRGQQDRTHDSLVFKKVREINSHSMKKLQDQVKEYSQRDPTYPSQLPLLASCSHLTDTLQGVHGKQPHLPLPASNGAGRTPTLLAPICTNLSYQILPGKELQENSESLHIKRWEEKRPAFCRPVFAWAADGHHYIPTDVLSCIHQSKNGTSQSIFPNSEASNGIGWINAAPTDFISGSPMSPLNSWTNKACTVSGAATQPRGMASNFNGCVGFSANCTTCMPTFFGGPTSNVQNIIHSIAVHREAPSLNAALSFSPAEFDYVCCKGKLAEQIGSSAGDAIGKLRNLASINRALENKIGEYEEFFNQVQGVGATSPPPLTNFNKGIQVETLMDQQIPQPVFAAEEVSSPVKTYAKVHSANVTEADEEQVTQEDVSEVTLAKHPYVFVVEDRMDNFSRYDRQAKLFQEMMRRKKKIPLERIPKHRTAFPDEPNPPITPYEFRTEVRKVYANSHFTPLQKETAEEYTHKFIKRRLPSKFEGTTGLSKKRLDRPIPELPYAPYDINLKRNSIKVPSMTQR